MSIPYPLVDVPGLNSRFMTLGWYGSLVSSFLRLARYRCLLFKHHGLLETDSSSSCILFRTMMTMITVRADTEPYMRCDGVRAVPITVALLTTHHHPCNVILFVYAKPDFLLFLPWAMHVSALWLMPSLLSSTLSVDSRCLMLDAPFSANHTKISFSARRSVFHRLHVVRCCCCCQYLAFGCRFPVLTSPWSVYSCRFGWVFFCWPHLSVHPNRFYCSVLIVGYY